MPLIEADPYARQVIGCAIEVHKTLGPSLLESIYETCLCLELTEAGLTFQRQPNLKLTYKNHPINAHLRPGLIVEQTLFIEIKSVQTFLPIHEAQLHAYLKLSGLKTGLILNVYEPRLTDGIRRRLL
jgi:GxxExxY protein